MGLGYETTRRAERTEDLTQWNTSIWGKEKEEEPAKKREKVQSER